MLLNFTTPMEVNESTYFLGKRDIVSEDLYLSRRLACNNTQPYKFAYARTALKYGLVSLGIKYGDSLLVPELICESVSESLKELGVKLNYYSINLMLEPDYNSLEKEIKDTTKGMLIIHYFGQPQLVKKCLEYCNMHSIFLIEDNAHGFGGTLNGQLLGTFGSVGVCSLRKIFPIRNGAYLYITKTSNFNCPNLLHEPYKSSIVKGFLKYFIQHIPPVKILLKYRKHEIEKRKRLGPTPLYGSQEAFRNSPLKNDYGMDKSSEQYILMQDINEIKTKRQEIYYIWQQWIEKQGLIPVFRELEPGAMPLIFPAFTDSSTASLKWYKRGHNAGVDIHSWPTLPIEIVKKDGQAMRIWERLVCFPIHQGMDIKLLKNKLALI